MVFILEGPQFILGLAEGPQCTLMDYVRALIHVNYVVGMLCGPFDKISGVIKRTNLNLK